jgi:hypothetical protein
MDFVMDFWINENMLVGLQLSWTVTFDSDSKLRRIEAFAFAGSALTALLLPNSIRLLPGLALVKLPLNTISFCSGSDKIHVRELFIKDVTGRYLRRSFEQSSRVLMEYRKQVICDHCLFGFTSLELLHLIRTWSELMNNSSSCINRNVMHVRFLRRRIMAIQAIPCEAISDFFM